MRETSRGKDKKPYVNNNRKSETTAVICGGLMIILPRLANMPMFEGDVRLEPFKEGISIGIYKRVS